MPEAEITLPDGRRARLEGPTREAVTAAARRLANQGEAGVDPNTGRTDPDLATLDRLMAGTAEGRPMESSIANQLRSLQREETLPMAGATAASMLFPPLAAGRAASLVAPALSRLGLGTSGGLGLLARGARRFGPSIGAAGAGGGAAGGALEASEGGSAADVARAAGRSGAEMAAGEAAGLGLGAAAGRIAAPAAGLLEDTGRSALRFARENTLPGSSRAITGREQPLPISPADVAPGRAQQLAQSVVDTLLPSRAYAQGQRRAVVNRVLETPPREANQTLKRLIEVDTSDVPLPKQKATASAVARSLGKRDAKRFGFEANEDGGKELVARVFRNGSENQIGRLSRRMGKNQFEDAKAINLAALIDRSTFTDQSGRRLIDGERLLQQWENLPEATRNLYPKQSRDAVENFAGYAAAHRRTPELAGEPTLNFQSGTLTTGVGAAPSVLAEGMGATASGFGISAGVSYLTARSLMRPKGFLNRWLTNEKLPSEVAQTIGGQATRFETRRRAAEDE